MYSVSGSVLRIHPLNPHYTLRGEQSSSHHIYRWQHWGTGLSDSLRQCGSHSHHPDHHNIFQAGSPRRLSITVGRSALQIAGSNVKWCYSDSLWNAKGNISVFLQPVACCPLLSIPSRTWKHQRGLGPRFHSWFSAGHRKSSCARVGVGRAETPKEHLQLLFVKYIRILKIWKIEKRKKYSPNSHHVNISTVSTLEYFCCCCSFPKGVGVLVVFSRK